MAALTINILDGPHRGSRVLDAEPTEDSPTGHRPAYLFILAGDVTPVFETDVVPDDASVYESYELPAGTYVYGLVKDQRIMAAYRLITGHG